VRTADGRLAGSSLTLDAAVRNWTAFTEASPAEAIAAGSEVPAAILGRAGGLVPGADANVVLLDDSCSVLRVMRRGRWVES
jgi:N-acetylglucosamine-6-phosphate deacetylase